MGNSFAGRVTVLPRNVNRSDLKQKTKPSAQSQALAQAGVRGLLRNCLRNKNMHLCLGGV